MRHTLYGLVAILCFSICPAFAEVFDYNECVARGRGTDHEAMGQTAYQKYFSAAKRQADCAKIADQVKARERGELQEDRQQEALEAQRRIQNRTRWQEEQALECDRCLRSGKSGPECDRVTGNTSRTCFSSSELEEQIRKAKQEAQSPKVVGRSADRAPRFVLLDEVKEPPAKRQPEISFGTHVDSSNRYVLVAAEGLIAPRQVHVVCDQEARNIPLTTSVTENGRTIATYEASRATESVALAARSCDLVLAGARLSIPQDKLAIVWGGFTPAANTKR